jgi:hypothetical protein
MHVGSEQKKKKTDDDAQRIPPGRAGPPPQNGKAWESWETPTALNHEVKSGIKMNNTPNLVFHSASTVPRPLGPKKRCELSTEKGLPTCRSANAVTSQNFSPPVACAPPNRGCAAQPFATEYVLCGGGAGVGQQQPRASSLAHLTHAQPSDVWLQRRRRRRRRRR